MKKLALLILSGLIACPTAALAVKQITVNSTVPSTAGIYSLLQLVPRNWSTALAQCSNLTHIGRFYFNTNTNQIEYCAPTTPLPTWLALNGPWTQSSNNVYLGGLNPENKKVGIGTSTPKFRLTLDNNSGAPNPDGGIFAKGTLNLGDTLGTLGTLGSYMIFYPRKGAFRAGNIAGSGYVPGTFGPGQLDWDDNWVGYSSVAFGQDTTASGYGAVVAGGVKNVALLNFCTVGGGEENLACVHNAAPTYATIAGGWKNSARSAFSFIGGGSNNIAGEDPPDILLTRYITIAGGRSNHAAFDFSTIGGGQNNIILALSSTISGGTNNEIQSLVNTVSNTNNAIGGGFTNKIINSGAATIAGGNTNTITLANFATISGGFNNTANGQGAVVSGGSNNIANGIASVVSGGDSNFANGDFSWAGGRNMQLDLAADNTFVWGVNNVPTTITTANAFLIFPTDQTARVGIGTTTPTQQLHLTNAMRLDSRTDAPGTCLNTNDGVIYNRDNGINKTLCYCDGTSWIDLTNRNLACSP